MFTLMRPLTRYVLALIVVGALLAAAEGLARLDVRPRILRLPLPAAVTLHPLLIVAPPDADGPWLAHEYVHVMQQRRDGWLRSQARWLMSRQWRERYEAEAANSWRYVP